jgi:hypothetical protein
MAAVREIKFLCVARKTDKVVLASRTHTSDKVCARWRERAGALCAA